MDLLTEASVPAVAMASALAVGAGAYLNAKLAISTDLTTIRNDRSFKKRLTERIVGLGESTTIYKLLERIVEVEARGANDALWFEQKTWTYTQLKDGTFASCSLLLKRQRQLILTVFTRSGGSLCGSASCEEYQGRGLCWCLHYEFARNGGCALRPGQAWCGGRHD